MNRGINKLEREVEAIEDKLRKMVEDMAEIGERRSRQAVDRIAEVGERRSRQAVDRVLGRKASPWPHPVLVTGLILSAGLLGAVLWSLRKDLNPPTDQDDRPDKP